MVEDLEFDVRAAVVLHRWLWSLLLVPALGQGGPLFDTHLHYRVADAELLPPPAMLAMFDELQVERAVIDALYHHAPDQPVIWAHAGSYPYPPLLADYLERYPALLIDLSVRDERIAPDGELNEGWYELLLRYPDRFLVGVDTFSQQRWRSIDRVVAKTRHWLDQLPLEIANKLACGNARQLFGSPVAPK